MTAKKLEQIPIWKNYFFTYLTHFFDVHQHPNISMKIIIRLKWNVVIILKISPWALNSILNTPYIITHDISSIYV